MGNGFALDSDAEELFATLEGIKDQAVEEASGLSQQMSELLQVDEEKRDVWRMLMIELGHLIGSYFKDVGLWRGIKREKEFFRRISSVMLDLKKMPDQDGGLSIRYRGFTSASQQKASEGEDYIIQFGKLTVDTDITAAMVKRAGIKMQHLLGQVNNMFQTLANHNIHTLYLKLPTADDKALQQIWKCIKILSLYHQARQSNSPIVLKTENESRQFALVMDENHHPDPNLTLVVGLNGLKARVMTDLVAKVNDYIQRAEASGSRQQFTSVYNAIFGIDSLKQKLIKPPIEINNVKWVVMDRFHSVVPKEKAKVARLVASEFGQTPLQVPQVMNSVYGDDFNKLDVDHLSNRLETASELLTKIDSDTENQEVLGEVISNIQTRMSQVSDDVLDDISVEKDRIKIKTPTTTKIIDQGHKLLLKMLDFTKKKSATKRKVKSLLSRNIDFDNQDYENLSQEFGISTDNIKVLIEHLKSCFDDEGRFKRATFEKAVPTFIKYEEKIFDFLWHYLKEIPRRNDRVAFLNALQLLIIKMQQPQKAVRSLLADFLSDPDAPRFNDRNALMLANLLLRKYNKEINIDIEMTPEEVLMIRDGLNKEVVQAAIETFEEDPDPVFEKARSIRRAMMEALEGGKSNSSQISLRFLFSLKKEFYIFLALVGGRSARLIIRNALRLYGNPEAHIYLNGVAKRGLPNFMQHLKVVVRGIGRVGHRRDIAVLNEIAACELAFKKLDKSVRHQASVGRIMQWVDKSKYSISAKG